MAVKFKYCPGVLSDNSYCPLNDICYRCCECEKKRQLTRYGERTDSFALYDKEKKYCPLYLNKAQWITIKMYADAYQDFHDHIRPVSVRKERND